MKRIVDESGVTLVEALVAAGIATMIVGVLGTAIFLCMRVTEEGNNEFRTQHDVQNAGYWITRDGQSAQTTDLVPGAEDVETMTLEWNAGVDDHTVVYYLAGTDLQRQIDGDEMTIARHVTSVGFSLSVDGMIAATIQSSTEGRWESNREVTFLISPRALS
jgi:hypothetical protein